MSETLKAKQLKADIARAQNAQKLAEDFISSLPEWRAAQTRTAGELLTMSRKISEAQRVVKRSKKQIAAAEEALKAEKSEAAARQQAKKLEPYRLKYSDNILDSVGPERDEWIRQLQADIDSTATDQATKRFLNHRLHQFNEILADEKREAEAVATEILETQASADKRLHAQAYDDLVGKARKMFSLPMSLEHRRHLQSKFREFISEENRAIRRVGCTHDERVVRKARAAALEHLIFKLEPFTLDIRAAGADEIQAVKELFTGDHESDFRFRGTSKTRFSEEQARWCLAARNIYANLPEMLRTLPNCPVPTLIRPLLAHDLDWQLDLQAAKDQYELSQPTSPLPVLYVSHGSTLDRPHERTRYYLGEMEVQVGIHVFRNREGRFFLPPEPRVDGFLQPTVQPPAPEEYEQDPYDVGEDGLPKWKLVSQLTPPPDALVPASSVMDPPQELRVVLADHLPDPTDDRHPDRGGHHVLGSFYSDADYRAATQKHSRSRMHFAPVNDTPVTLSSAPPIGKRSSAVWAAHEQKIAAALADEDR